MFHLSSLETTNSDLAAALCAVGIPLKKETPVRILTGHGGDRHCFFFEERSPCGSYLTSELIQAWDDKEWYKQHPEHPFAYIKVAMQNRSRLLDYVKKGTPICVVQKAGKLAFLSLNASSEAEQKLFKRLNSHR